MKIGATVVIIVVVCLYYVPKLWRWFDQKIILMRRSNSEQSALFKLLEIRHQYEKAWNKHSNKDWADHTAATVILFMEQQVPETHKAVKSIRKVLQVHNVSFNRRILKAFLGEDLTKWYFKLRKTLPE